MSSAYALDLGQARHSSPKLPHRSRISGISSGPRGGADHELSDLHRAAVHHVSRLRRIRLGKPVGGSPTGLPVCSPMNTCWGLAGDPSLKPDGASARRRARAPTDPGFPGSVQGREEVPIMNYLILAVLQLIMYHG